MTAVPSDDPNVVRRTQRLDIARSVPLGLLYPLESSVLLTIAVKHFHANGVVKALVAAAGGIGLLLSPAVTALARRSSRKSMEISSVAMAVGCLGFIAAATGSVALFTAGVIVGIAANNTAIPLMTVVYERNFPVRERGRRVGRGLALKVAVAAVAGLVMGAALKRDIDNWRFVVLIGVLAGALLVASQLPMPSDSLAHHDDDSSNSPWPRFALLRSDRQLRLTLGAWMLMGFGNLMLLPLRVIYLNDERYGIKADASKITILTVVIPSVVRFLMMPVFGQIFDRLSFFASRIVVNMFFALYVAAFFTGTSDLGLAFGAVMLGIGSSGGDLMWSLWVTKFAPQGRVADYMGLHTFFTGVRATFAPMVAFAIVTRLALGTVAIICAALMVASALALLPEARAERARRALQA